MKYDLSYIAAQILWEAHQEGEQGGGKGTADGGVTDDELVLQCQAELPYQIEAFETLVNRYRHKVFGKCLSMVKNTEDAYDVTQDIFIRVFNGIKNFKRKSSFSTWLYTITVNTCLNFIEKKQRRPWWWITEDVAEIRKDQVADEDLFFTVDNGLERSDMRKSIETVLAHISENASEILYLRYFEEMDYKSIAEKLNIGLSAAKMRLKRAREEFKEQYQNLIETYEYE